MQDLVDLEKCWKKSIYLQKSASIQRRTSPSKFGGKSCLDSLSTAQVGVRRACGDPPRVDAGEQGLGFGHCDLRLRRWDLNFCPRPTSDGRFVGCESRGTRRRAGVRGPPVVLPQVAESGRRLTRSELLAKRPYSGGHWPGN